MYFGSKVDCTRCHFGCMHPCYYMRNFAYFMCNGLDSHGYIYHLIISCIFWLGSVSDFSILSASSPLPVFGVNWLDHWSSSDNTGFWFLSASSPLPVFGVNWLVHWSGSDNTGFDLSQFCPRHTILGSNTKNIMNSLNPFLEGPQVLEPCGLC